MTEAVCSASLIVVNGEDRSVTPGSSVGDLLRALELDPRMIVVEHNRVILRDRSAYDSLSLLPGDTIEIVHFVGGG
ncbi:MAG: sulfur carrier protein ThiS [Gemmatimonadaceae bacterium]